MTEREKLGLLNDGVCTFCGESTDAIAGNPGKWPLWFPHPGDAGVSRVHHSSCVAERLFPRDGGVRAPEGENDGRPD